MDQFKFKPHFKFFYASIVSFLVFLLVACNSNFVAQTPRSDRFTQHNGDEAWVVQESLSSPGEQNQVSSKTISTDVSVTLALSVNPPAASRTDGVQVYASDLSIYGTRIATSYNVPGSVQKGWIDYIDVTTLAVPLLLDSEYFPQTDINSLDIDIPDPGLLNLSAELIAVGSEDGKGSTFVEGRVGLLGMSVDKSTTRYLTSYAGTGAVSLSDTIATTTGDSGHFSIFKRSDGSSISEVDIPDARGLDFHSRTQSYFVVAGQPGRLLKLDSTGNLISEVGLGGASIAESKATVKSGRNFVLATTGDGGFSVVCAQDNQIAASMGQYIYPDYQNQGLPEPKNTVTNGAVFGPGLIFTASGEAGVRIYKFRRKAGISPTACENVEVSYLGHLEFTEHVSANNLYYRPLVTTLNSYVGELYLAAGSGGFKALTVVVLKEDLLVIDYE